MIHGTMPRPVSRGLSDGNLHIANGTVNGRSGRQPLRKPGCDGR